MSSHSRSVACSCLLSDNCAEALAGYRLPPEQQDIYDGKRALEKTTPKERREAYSKAYRLGEPRRLDARQRLQETGAGQEPTVDLASSSVTSVEEAAAHGDPPF